MKKILSIALALCLCLGALPMGAQAAPITTPLDFTNVGDGEGETPAEGPGYKLEGNKDSGYTLTLDGISMNVTSFGPNWTGGQAVIRLPSEGSVTVKLTGTNTIHSPNEGTAIGCYGNNAVIFEGTGALSADARTCMLHANGDITIRNVTIGNSSPGTGIFSLGGNITIEGANVNITSDGNNGAAIYAGKGNIQINKSEVSVSCDQTNAIYADDSGTISITESTIVASSNCADGSAIVCKGNLNISDGSNITASGNTRYGICSWKNMTVSQSEISATGTTLGIYGVTGLTVQGVALTYPADGKIDSGFIRESDNALAKSIKLGKVSLNDPASTPTCTYGDTDTAKVTLTTTPPIISKVEIYNGDTKVGEGDLGEEITLDTSALSVEGHNTLIAKLPDGLGEKEFTVKVEPKNISGATVELDNTQSNEIKAGEIFEPKVTSVTLSDGTKLTAGDYTLDTKSFSTPGSHRVTVSGTGNYCGTASAELNLTAVCKLDKPADRTDLQVTVGGVKVVSTTPDPYQTVGKIQAALKGKMPSGVEDENISYLDVTLRVQKPDGKWEEATTKDFETLGSITVTLPYPDGVTKDNKDQYQFIVVHLPYYNNQYWPLETISCTAVDGGLMCTFTSLCPVAIGYKAKPSGGGGGGGGGGTPSGPCTGGPGCPSRAFADLDTSLWYHEATDFVLQNRLMDGYGNGLFGPGDNLTRAQFAQILYNRAGRPQAPEDCPFTDVAPGAWYAPAIRWAASQGVLEGYGGGLFGPEDPITREQLAAMLWRYAGKPVAAGSGPDFTDADKISGYALSALRWAVEQGIVQGRGGGILDPAGTATRAEAAQMVMKYSKRY